MHAVSLGLGCFSRDNILGGGLEELVELVVTGLDVGRLLPGFLCVDNQCLSPLCEVAGCAKRGMKNARDQREKRCQGDF